MLQRGWLDGGVVREKTFVAKFARHATHEREVRRHDKFAHAHRHTRRCRTNNSRSAALLAPLTVVQPPADAEPALPPHSGYPPSPLLVQSLPFLLKVVHPPLLVQSLPFLLTVVHPFTPPRLLAASPAAPSPSASVAPQRSPAWMDDADEGPMIDRKLTYA